VYTVAGLIERTQTLSFFGEREVRVIAINQDANRKPSRSGEVYQVKAVVRLEPYVGNQPVIGMRE
jgi:hypothetical protein